MTLWTSQIIPHAPDASGTIFDPLTQAIMSCAALPPVLPWWREGVDAARHPPPVLLGHTAPPGNTLHNVGDLSVLSAREREILALLAVGLPNRAIAQRLVIAETTVKWYVKQIFLKLDVHNRTQAVAWLHTHL